MSTIKRTRTLITSIGWQNFGVTLAVAACILTYLNDGTFWPGLLETILIGAACFCLGASFHENINRTCPEESETN